VRVFSLIFLVQIMRKRRRGAVGQELLLPERKREEGKNKQDHIKQGKGKSLTDAAPPANRDQKGKGRKEHFLSSQTLNKEGGGGEGGGGGGGGWGSQKKKER